ncbi:FecR family protein [Mucilaginibacter oryzae]|uniref:FecR family protein n=1 Tax=Mucilaginibacter oryzae TaxID=468058 RepID=A0A316HF80_9SPHI|nr:FecR family protein [Mucilaginibacter oryzae]PWK79067.1 FecR family protein [Mucilaginibacter oryzae]
MSERLNYLFHQYFNKTETPAERDELMRLINTPGSEFEVQSLMEEVFTSEHFDIDPFAPGTRERMLNTVFEGTVENTVEERIIPLTQRLNKIIYIAAAAVLVLALSLGIYQYRSQKNKEALAATRPQPDVKPGGNKAVLTLANGAKIELNDAKNGKLVQQGNTAVVKLANGSVAYVAGNQSAGTSMINTMSTPRGGQYRLQLPDGTIVMLNAESSVSYPTAFTGKIRNVSITGEAYFEVAKDKKMPFIVTFGKQKVEVLGTHFDIRAYNEQPGKTTLLEGSVKISNGSQKQLLVPGQQAVYNTGAQKFDIKAVDTDDIVAWKNGLFVFDNTELDQVMLELARWYDIDIEYKGVKPQLNFTGLVKKNIPLSKALKILETTGGIKFTIAANKVIIEKK